MQLHTGSVILCKSKESKITHSQYILGHLHYLPLVFPTLQSFFSATSLILQDSIPLKPGPSHQLLNYTEGRACLCTAHIPALLSGFPARVL